MHACLELGEFDAGVFISAWAQTLADHATAPSDASSLFHWHVLTRASAPPSLASLNTGVHARTPEHAALRQMLSEACWGLLPGVHRLRLRVPSHPHVLTHLTFCIGETSAALASLDTWMRPAVVEDRASPVIVIGAGLAGAACARALADRGYAVRVLDQGTAPAAGASGLPVGLVAPHASPDDSVISRLSRAGLRAMRDRMTHLLREGQDWGNSGVQERRLPGKTRKGGAPAMWRTHWPTEGAAWTSDFDALNVMDTPAVPDHTLWHPKGAWVRPAALVRALLQHPRIHWQGQAQVTHLACATQGGASAAKRWSVMHHDDVLAQGAHIVLAMGPATPKLLQDSGLAVQALPMRPLRGQLSWGRMADLPETDGPWPHSPVNGHGCFIHSIASEDGPAWFAGSTFDRTRESADILAQDHAENLTRVQALLPEHAPQFEAAFAPENVRAWAGVRCSVPDRLPMVGAVPDAPEGLWVCSAMGSRGLTLAVLCGETLAAQWTGEPSPLEPALARALTSSRFVKP